MYAAFCALSSERLDMQELIYRSKNILFLRRLLNFWNILVITKLRIVKSNEKTKTNNTHENNVFIVIIIVIKKPLVGTLGKDIDALCHPANVAMCRC